MSANSRKFEWDESKNIENIRKHRIDFSDVPKMFDQPMSISIDGRNRYGEERWIGTGFLLNGIAVVVWTERRNDTIRIISARRANKYERQQFKRYLSN